MKAQRCVFGAFTAVVMVMLGACGQGSAEQGKYSALPEPCDLVDDGTAQQLVGSTASESGPSAPTMNGESASCSWEFDAEDVPGQGGRYRRTLSVEVILYKNTDQGSSVENAESSFQTSMEQSNGSALSGVGEEAFWRFETPTLTRGGTLSFRDSNLVVNVVYQGDDVNASGKAQSMTEAGAKKGALDAAKAIVGHI
ncbi:MAG: hypothetical protein GEV03_17550 [Streptosporangiales bacterium]|nr:hypothetical protein [Streptosporangiales bacterium]